MTTTENEPKLNTYNAYYKGKQIEVKALTSYLAQGIAAKIFHAKHSYDITIIIACHADGESIVHIPTM